jgi:hypothetical protein
MNKEMMILMATAVPTDKIVDDLKEAIEEWEINPSELNEQKLVFYSHLLTMSFMTKGDITKAMKVTSDMDKIEKIAKNFLNNEN